MMTIFSLYLPILLSIPLSFLLHAFKKHLHSFFLYLFTTFKNNVNATILGSNIAEIYKFRQFQYFRHPISSPSPVFTRAIESLPSPIRSMSGSTDDGVDKLTESLRFESFEIKKIEDRDDGSNVYNNDEDEDDDEDGEEGIRDCRELKDPFPPLLSSLNQKGESSFVLVPVRENGRLQLNRVRVKRPQILYSSREDGRLRLYHVPQEEEEDYEGESEQELVEEEEEEIVELSREEEEMVGYGDEREEDDDDEEEEEEEEDRVVGEWRFPLRCHHHVVSQHHHHHHHMYGVGIA